MLAGLRTGFEPATSPRLCSQLEHNLQIMSDALFLEAGALTRLSYPGTGEVAKLRGF